MVNVLIKSTLQIAKKWTPFNKISVFDVLKDSVLAITKENVLLAPTLMKLAQVVSLNTKKLQSVQTACLQQNWLMELASGLDVSPGLLEIVRPIVKIVFLDILCLRIHVLSAQVICSITQNTGMDVINVKSMTMENHSTVYLVSMMITSYSQSKKPQSQSVLIQESKIVLSKNGMKLNARNVRLDSTMLELNVLTVQASDVLNVIQILTAHYVNLTSRLSLVLGLKELSVTGRLEFQIADI